MWSAVCCLSENSLLESYLPILVEFRRSLRLNSFFRRIYIFQIHNVIRVDLRSMGQHGKVFTQKCDNQ
ncbi:hypothetical protein D3C81_850840 [compost metagenome]